MLDINTGPILWTILNFVILLLVLRAVAWKPILNALHTREASINDALDRAERAKADAERILAENQSAMQKAEEEGQRVLRESREFAEKLQSEASARAQQETQRLLQDARQEIERSKQQALVELRGEVATIAVDAAEKILKESLDADRHKRLVNEYLNQAVAPQN